MAGGGLWLLGVLACLLAAVAGAGEAQGQHRGPPIDDGFVLVDDMLLPVEWLGESALASVNLWPGVIPYAFDANVSVLNQGRMRTAMDELEAVANVWFVPHTTEQAFVQVQSGSSNSAHLGMLGGQQSLTISSWTVHYTIVHELLHVLGFVHEHQRPDRDLFIAVQTANLVPAALSQYDIIATSTAVGPYDFDSVMHYGQCQGSTCGASCTGCEAMLVLPPHQAWQALIGQRDHLSTEDAAGLVTTYGSWDCDGNGVHDFLDIQAGVLEDCNGNGRPDACEAPGTFPDCNGNGTDDACEIAAGSASDCNLNGVPDGCDVTAGVLDDCDGDGVADLCQLQMGTATDCNGNGQLDGCDIALGRSPDVDRNGVPDECDVPVILHVDAGATGSGDGAIWASAIPQLQDALAMGAAAPNVVEEIWVAAGTYRPAPPGGPRAASFALTRTVELLGGFAGTEVSASEREPGQHVTVLSGDLDGDDGPGFSNRSDNSYHVVTAPAPESEGAPPYLLDGFRVEGGQADGPSSDDRIGAGLRTAGTTVVRACDIRDNQALDAGGGIHASLGPLQLERTVVQGNRAGQGGGVYTHKVEVEAVNSLFVGNEAALTAGGGLGGLDGRPILTNVTFVGNTAATSGGGLGLTGGQLELVNGILWDNADAGGGGESAQVSGTGASLGVDHSCIDGLTGALGGTGNVAAPSGMDALFLDGRGPDGLPGSGDEDLRLTQGSPANDAGDGKALPPGTHLDLAGSRRFADDDEAPDTGLSDGLHGPIVDMGAHEYRCRADVDGDGQIDLHDVEAVAQSLGQPGGPRVPADVTRDGVVDDRDVHLVLRAWAWGGCP